MKSKETFCFTHSWGYYRGYLNDLESQYTRLLRDRPADGTALAARMHAVSVSVGEGRVVSHRCGY